MYFHTRPAFTLNLSTIMFKLFRKTPVTRPHVEPTAALEAEHARRVSAIQFKPSKGFLKDEQQPKRSVARAQRSA